MSNAKNAYSTLPDDVLATLTKSHDEQAFNELVLRYLGKISCVARKYSARGYEHTDFVQEGLLGLYCAAKTFDPDGGRTFRNYAMLVAERRFISIIRRQASQRSVPDSAIIGFDMLDADIVDTAKSPEDELMLREQIEAVRQRLREVLSRREYEVLNLYVYGMSYSQIAEKLGVSSKAVDNALQRARRKVGGIDMS